MNYIPAFIPTKLMLGEVLYEACNQNELEVVTFAERPWSKSYVTFIWVRQEKNETVCRDETGSLPDLGIKIQTPRGIKLGDSKDKIYRKYGRPDEESKLEEKNKTILRYFGKGKFVEYLRLIFVLKNDTLNGISLSDESLSGGKPYR